MSDQAVLTQDSSQAAKAEPQAETPQQVADRVNKAIAEQQAIITEQMDNARKIAESKVLSDQAMLKLPMEEHVQALLAGHLSAMRVSIEDAEKRIKSFEREKESATLGVAYEQVKQYLEQTKDGLVQILSPYKGIRKNFNTTISLEFNDEGGTDLKISHSGSSTRKSSKGDSKGGAGVKSQETVYKGTPYPSAKAALEAIKTVLGLPSDYGANASAVSVIKRLVKGGKLPQADISVEA